AIPAEEFGARIAAAAFHRADGAQHRCLDVDTRSGVQRAKLVSDRPRRAEARTLMALQPSPGNGLDHLHQYLSRPAVLLRHIGCRVAVRAAGTLRGCYNRRRERLAALPLRHFAVIAADHSDRDPVFGDIHLRGLPAGLCTDAWRAAKCDATVRDLCL